MTIYIYSLVKMNMKETNTNKNDVNRLRESLGVTKAMVRLWMIASEGQVKLMNYTYCLFDTSRSYVILD